MRNFKGISELPMLYQKMLRKAEEVMKNAYNPYSGYSVGACALCSDPKMFVGTNAENAAYGSSICAERAAILNANAEGCGDKIVAIAIITKGKNTTQPMLKNQPLAGLAGKL